MFVGRRDELRQLEGIYQTDHSNLLVLYGRSGIGKTALTRQFTRGKTTISYLAQECTELEQSKLLGESLGEEEQTDYSCIVRACENCTSDDKRIVIIDEFQFMADGSENFKELLIKLFTSVEKGSIPNGVMVVLISSSINWVENSMVSKLGAAAKLITGYLKLSELNFADIVEWFGRSSVEDCIIIKAVLGGIPAYLKLWQENRRVRENIIELFLSSDSLLKNEAERILKAELRELPAYNTILAALADGKIKLNDIYADTGFSRAKISVYLKNLMQMDIVEKIYSYDKSGRENLQKGLYRIKDNFLNFYFAFVFRNCTLLQNGAGKAVYENAVTPRWNLYLRKPFADVCREFIELMSLYGRLKNKYVSYYVWYGKQGIIDIIAEDEKGKCLIAGCTFGDEVVGLDELNDLQSLAVQAGIKPRQIYLFSRKGFNDDIAEFSKNSEGYVSIVALSDL